MATEILDRKFVIAATAIGAAYAALVVGLNAWIGPQAAGVAGVALTALATAIFKQFETLRFRKVAVEEQVDVRIPGVSWWWVALAAASITGMHVTLVDLERVAYNWTWGDPPPYWVFPAVHHGINFGSFLVGGFLVAKTSLSKAYSNVAIGAALAVFGLFVMWKLIDPLPEPIDFSSDSPYWLAFVLASVLGAKLGNLTLRKRGPSPDAGVAP